MTKTDQGRRHPRDIQETSSSAVVAFVEEACRHSSRESNQHSIGDLAYELKLLRDRAEDTK